RRKRAADGIVDGSMNLGWTSCLRFADGERRGRQACLAFVTPAGTRSALGLGVLFVDRVPVDHVPPVGDVLGTAVLILEVVGVLPHVQAQDGRLAVHQRAVLGGGGGPLETALP